MSSLLVKMWNQTLFNRSTNLSRQKLFWKTDEDKTMNPFTYTEVNIIAVTVGIFVVLILAGNMFIMIAYSINKNLRTINNYFLVSLSMADFLIGMIAVPGYTAHILLGNWTIGSVACKFWLSADYGLTTSSTLHLLLISLDRYLSVKHPLRYRVHRTPKRVLIVILLVWIISFLLWMPPIFILSETPLSEINVPTTECLMPYVYSQEYFVIVILGALTFWLPVSLMVGFYYKVYVKTLKHKQFVSKYVHRRTLYIINNKLKQTVIKEKNKITASACETGAGQTSLRVRMNTFTTCIQCPEDDITDHCGNINTSQKLHISISNEISVGSVHKNGYKKDNSKATKMLSSILLAYIITWLPWQVYTIVSYICTDCVPIGFYCFAYYFAYVNSAVNPFLYAMCNINFRSTFLHMLCCDLRNRRK